MKVMERKRKQEYSKTLFAACAFILGIVMLVLLSSKAKSLMKLADYQPMMKWWRMYILLGLAFLPLAAWLFQKFSDRGYFFARVLGIAVGGWLVWALSSLHIFKFTDRLCLCTVIFCAVVNYGLLIFYSVRKKKNALEFLGMDLQNCVWAKAVWYEVIFFTVFFILTFLKCYHPQAFGEEKFMDYGFMLSMYKSDYMPPEDFWYSGTNLNYYYLTQFFATFLTKLSGTTVNYAYNLAMMMTAGTCMVLVYSLVSRIFEFFMQEKCEEAKLRNKKSFAGYYPAYCLFPRIAGFLSGIIVTFSSTCHYFVYAKLVPIFREILGLGEGDSYWFPNATRYIGYQNEKTNDKTIHEFPSYSFIQGDLHAHVLNIVFVITILAILFAWLWGRKERMKNAARGELLKISFKEELLQPHIIMMSFFIGLFHMTNFWDFPIYFVVCGAVILVSNAVISGFSAKSIQLTALQAVEFLAISKVVSFLFSRKFKVMAAGIGICDKHSALYQLIIVWAMPVIAVFAFLCITVKEERKRKEESTNAKKSKNAFFAWLENLRITDLYLLILGFCAAGLVLIPEVIYVVDIYGGDYKRANTMFKLTYQAYIMFGIVLGALTVRFLLLGKTKAQFIGGLVLLFLTVENAGYFETACKSWYGDIKKDNYKTLDAAEFIYSEPD